jgi:hypothetical protein
MHANFTDLGSSSSFWTTFAQPIFLAALAIASSGCDVKKPARADTPEPTARAQATAAPPAGDPAGGTAREKLGDPIHDTAVVPLSAIAQNPTQYAKNVVKTEGKVTAVCQAMGCWMEIADQNADAHIKMSGHRFFVPRTAAGRHAVVEGTVLANPAQGECEQEAQQATGKTVRVELVATGVELL